MHSDHIMRGRENITRARCTGLWIATHKAILRVEREIRCSMFLCILLSKNCAAIHFGCMQIYICAQFFTLYIYIYIESRAVCDKNPFTLFGRTTITLSPYCVTYIFTCGPQLQPHSSVKHLSVASPWQLSSCPQSQR